MIKAEAHVVEAFARLAPPQARDFASAAVVAREASLPAELSTSVSVLTRIKAIESFNVLVAFPGRPTGPCCTAAKTTPALLACILALANVAAAFAAVSV
jgi:hypothetical protein